MLSAVGIPPGSRLFGAACAAGGGMTPRIQAFGDLPSSTTGTPGFGITLSKAPGGASAFLVVGSSALTPPLNLSPFGLPGCKLRVEPDLLIPAVTTGSGTADGRALVPFPIPADPALAGAVAYFQWFVAGPAPGEHSVSKALLLTVL